MCLSTCRQFGRMASVMTGTVYREEGCESGARLAHLVQVAPDLTNSPFSVVRGRALSWRA